MNTPHLDIDTAASDYTDDSPLEDTRPGGPSMAPSGYDKAAQGLRAATALMASLASLRTLAQATGMIAPGRSLLGLMRLQRRPSLVSRVATSAGFAVAGAAVGAGFALLFAPQTGAALRAQIGHGLRTLQEDTEEAATQAVASVKSAVAAPPPTLTYAPATPPATPPTAAYTAAHTPKTSPKADGLRGDLAKLDLLHTDTRG